MVDGLLMVLSLLSLAVALVRLAMLLLLWWLERDIARMRRRIRLLRATTAALHMGQTRLRRYYVAAPN